MAFVVTECDKAMEKLDMHVATNRDLGRPTEAAALALKGKSVVVHDASPLWNGNPDYKNFTG